jgi:hypothetical protein
VYFVPLVKVKLLTTLSMVFMGLFSRLVLGFPALLSTSIPTFHSVLPGYQFPDSGNRTSLRFMSAVRYTQKSRRNLEDGSLLEEEISLLQAESDHSHFGLVGDVIEQEKA